MMRTVSRLLTMMLCLIFFIPAWGNEEDDSGDPQQELLDQSELQRTSQSPNDQQELDSEMAEDAILDSEENYQEEWDEDASENEGGYE